MRILVTGGAGFIGSHLVDRLMENEKNEVSIFYILDSCSNTNFCDQFLERQYNDAISRFIMVYRYIIEPNVVISDIFFR